MTRTVYVVPHCHWDREWYQPQELFRWRLVQMIDELIDHMESHPEFGCFNLDGQTIVIQDYLELRPENEGRLRALIESGRVVIGPWWVQPDEFLPSGESHIRSFQKGIRAAAKLGGSLRVGHCADQFGHIAQMPQIMSQLGLTSACLWRGVPDSVPAWSFYWQAPDGTRLPVLYLRNSYSSGWRLPNDPQELLERVRRQERDLREHEPAVLMNGTDHSRMEKQVPAALQAAAGTAEAAGYEFRFATLAEYEQAVFAAGIDEHVHAGELRSPDRSNVLVGVLSARANIKQRDFEVSSALERYAEPLELLSYLHHGPDGTPALRHAWGLALENSPHDSICGCSVDQTHREMFPRYDRAEQLADEIARESMAHLISRLEVPAGGGLAVFRPVPHAAATLECEVPDSWVDGDLKLPDGTLVPFTVGPATPPEVLGGGETTPYGAVRHLAFIREGRYDSQYVEAQAWELANRHLTVETVVGQDICVVDCDAVREEVRQVAANGLADSAEVRVIRSGRRTLRAVLPASDTVGLELLCPAEPATPPRPTTDIAATEDSIANGYYDVRFKKGRLRIRDWVHGVDLDNANAFVDEGDRGDEYNADILLDAVVEPLESEVLSITHDAVSATLRYMTLLEVPAALNKKRTRRLKRETAILPIVTEVTLWAGLPRIDFRVSLENTAEDHRLRALFPLPFAVETAWTENQFHVAQRWLTPPAWNGVSLERPPTTFPQKTFAAFEAEGRGLAVFNRGMQEGEVVQDEKGRQAYALTLLRCVGWLSRPDLVSRRGGAGPTIATADSQMPGEHTFEYALTTYRGGWQEALIQPMAHSFAHPPLAYATNEHEGSVAGSMPLAVFGSPQTVPSAMHRGDSDGAPIIRVFNASASAAEAGIRVPAGSHGAGLVDLMEQPKGEPASVSGACHFPLRPWEIATLRFGRR
ncbi:MAG TPA: glycoside hydrolase family 38 C-terminal domain-containing protein [Tepidiformaceae bacterium]|nr:glycoside hydrolase family 38 C-terminal domain-containing protein [Tepidiformaceae bacterium]